MKNYQLIYSLRSPFARRIRLALHRLELPFDLIEENVFEPSQTFQRLTPLGLVPALITPEGTLLTDSNNLLEILDERSGGTLWPRERVRRELVRQASVYATGLMTNIVNHFLESIQPHPSEAYKLDCEASARDTHGLAISRAYDQIACSPRSDSIRSKYIHRIQRSTHSSLSFTC